MKNFLYLLLLPAVFCFGLQQNEEEVLFLNRIADFWEEGEYSIAKNQIQEFLTLYPRSSFAGVLQAAIGEIFLREKQYQNALEAYAKIEDADIVQTVFPHRIECLYHMQWYPILADECEERLQKEPENLEITYYLAMALYHQCVMLGGKENARETALRAEPYFIKILEKESSPEISVAYAQILWILDKPDQSFDIYSRLAEENPELEDEAALMHLELLQFYYREKNWTACRENGKLFITKFPNHPQSIAARKFIVDAGVEVGDQETLLADLQEQIPFLQEDLPYQFLLAKTEFLLGRYEIAMEHLQKLIHSDLLTGVLETDAKLLLALCFRDALQDVPSFCTLGEEILQNEHEPSLLTRENLHAALYNAYLEQKLFFKAETHLFALFEKNQVDAENLTWLSSRYFDRRLTDPECKTKAIAILETLSPSEQSILQLSTLYFQNEETDKAVALLESWENRSPEMTLLLAEQYLSLNEEDKACLLLQSIPKTGSTLRTFAGASAALQSARIQIRKWTGGINRDDPLVERTLAGLKDIILHKNIAHEPVYLEAALDYIDLQNRCHHCASKHLLLLKKIRKDFESMDDLLSKDYHLGRENNAAKNTVYQSYLTFIEASIYLAQLPTEKDENVQKELQAKAKDLLLKLIDEQAPPALIARAVRCLDP